ncbi:AMP-binding protein [Acidiplasma sp.]|uniref:AMP-binding protein n=1 Tax=Acidiplasma sp. TaxID=1872114 RepID=UPI00258FED0A|nr:AMP-binding protein [Acidiplasma sp.]
MNITELYEKVKKNYDERYRILEDLRNMKPPEPFNWVQEIFEKFYGSDKNAVIYYNMENEIEIKVSYNRLISNYNKLINLLRKHGIKKSAVIYLMSPALTEQWYIMLAALKAGYTLIPLAPNLTEFELKFRFSSIVPDVIIADSENMKKISRSLKNRPLKISIGNYDDAINIKEINNENNTAEGEKLFINDVFIKYFTSGTTGMPKTVNHSAVLYPIGQLSTATAIGIRENYIHVNLSSPGWAKFSWSSVFSPLTAGATVLSIDYSGKLNVRKYLEVLDSYHVNSFCAPPTAWRQFISANLDGIELKDLRETVSAGEPLNAEIINKWREKFGTTVRDYYGQTESTAMVANLPGKSVIPGSMGRPLPTYNIVLLDEEMNEINKSFEPGLMAVKNYKGTYGLFLGYSDDEKNREVFIGDYYLTGDRAYRDDDGNFYFVSRSDDVIKSSDYRIGPFEVESAIIATGIVLESAVVGSPDRLKYQKVKAFIVLKDGHEKNEETARTIFNGVKKLLPSYKLPEIIEFVDDLPKTISGKIRRNNLREIEKEKRDNNMIGEFEYFMKKY